MIFIRRIWIWMIALTIAGLAAAAPPQLPPTPVTEADTLVYETIEKKPIIFGLPSDPKIENVKLVHKANGNEVYQAPTTAYEFNPQAIAATLKVGLATKLNLDAKSTKKGVGYPVNSTWKVAYVSPPRVGSICPRDVNFSYQVTVNKPSTINIFYFGRPTSIDLINTTAVGTWSIKGCGVGKFNMNVSYAPALQAIVNYSGTLNNNYLTFQSRSRLLEVTK